MHGSSKNDQFLLEKCLAKFVFDTKEQNSAFWDITNLGPHCNSVALYINFKSKWVFEILKPTENINSRGMGWVRNENVSVLDEKF